MVANGRRRENIIDVVEDEGRRISREDDKKGYFLKMFHKVFASDGSDNLTIGDWSKIFRDRTILNLSNSPHPFYGRNQKGNISVRW